MFSFNLNINFISNYINNFIKYIYYSINNNFTYNNIYDFISINKYILILLLFVYIGIIFDKTFKWKNKIFIGLYTIFFILFIILFRGNFFIDEIFWYTLALNGSFMFHACICDWVYRLFIYLDWDYGRFLITRISFFFSLSFILYLLNLSYLYLESFCENSKLNTKKWFLYLVYDIKIILYFLLLILLFFVRLFTDYVLILKGVQSTRLNIKKIIYIIFFIFITMFISTYIFGLPRLYFIWLFLALSYIYWLFIAYGYNPSRKVYSLSYIYWHFLRIAEYEYTKKIIAIGFNYEATNTKGFNYGFIYFIDYIKTIWNPEALDFHLKCPFLYYHREKFLLTYFRSYFKKYIRICNHISKENYYYLFEQAEQQFYLSSVEKDLLHKKFKKIYKKSLNINGNK